MTSFKKIQDSVSGDLERLNKIIGYTLKSSSPLMQQVVDNFLASKGKQLRPILVILSGQLFSNGTAVSDNVIYAGAAIELLHNASLIHDDVIDESQQRRGRPSINRIWDNHIAVLVGDFFVSGALYCAEKTQQFKIISVMAHLGRELSLGEIEQIDNARHHSIDEQTYIAIIRRKTASLFSSCVQVGGYAAGADDDRLADLRRYAEMLGLCFQIKDDIFDYFDNPEVGKPTAGNDLREGKMTLPLIYALSRTDLPEHGDMLALSRKQELLPDDIATLIKFAKDAGGIEYAYGVMERIRNEAQALLATYGNNETAGQFKTIFDYIFERSK